MTNYQKREGALLFLGDSACFGAALWLALALRSWEIPTATLFAEHLVPFSLLFVSWIFVFYIFGLYGKHTLFFKSRLHGLLFRAVLANASLAAFFFYFFPVFTITPKTILFLVVFLSFFLILWWRGKIIPSLGFRRRVRAVLIGGGKENDELLREVRGNARYPFSFVLALNPKDMPKDIHGNAGKNDAKSFSRETETIKKIREENIAIVVVDFGDENIRALLPSLYELLFSGVRFFDANAVYEDIFDRVPLSSLEHSWVLKNISGVSHKTYDILKRAMDITAAFLLGIVSLVISPFIFFAIKLDDGGTVLFTQERRGKGNKNFRVYKFRSMAEGGKEKITRVGSFLRKTRLDELPQLWNVLRGDLSLIGPRPELPELAEKYEENIPHYNLRHLITPGLSGWAQIRMEKPPKFAVVGYDETREKLSYDLSYLKRRSFLLDIKIALFTLKTLLSRSGV